MSLTLSDQVTSRDVLSTSIFPPNFTFARTFTIPADRRNSLVQAGVRTLLASARDLGMLFSFGPMAFDDIDWFQFDFSPVLVGDSISNITSLVATGGITLDDTSIAVVNNTMVVVLVTAGSESANSIMSCSITSLGGKTLTRSGIIPVAPLVPL